MVFRSTNGFTPLSTVGFVVVGFLHYVALRSIVLKSILEHLVPLKAIPQTWCSGKSANLTTPCYSGCEASPFIKPFIQSWNFWIKYIDITCKVNRPLLHKLWINTITFDAVLTIWRCLSVNVDKDAGIVHKVDNANKLTPKFIAMHWNISSLCRNLTCRLVPQIDA